MAPDGRLAVVKVLLTAVASVLEVPLTLLVYLVQRAAAARPAAVSHRWGQPRAGPPSRRRGGRSVPAGAGLAVRLMFDVLPT